MKRVVRLRDEADRDLTDAARGTRNSEKGSGTSFSMTPNLYLIASATNLSTFLSCTGALAER